jgi:hypothetical protein
MDTDILKLLFTIVGIFLLIIAAILIPSYLIDIYECNKYTEVTGRATEYKGISCYIQENDRWYSRKEFEYSQIGTTIINSD